MPLIQITTDLSKVAKSLERIAEALERLSPPIPEETIQSTESDLYAINYEKEGYYPPDDDAGWITYAPRSNYK